MRVTAEKVNNQWLFHVNGQAMTSKQFTAYIGVPYGTFTAQISKAKKEGYFQKKLEEYIWKYEHKLPQSTCVVRNPLGEISCTVYVKRKVPEVPEHEARKRLRLWKIGSITTKELYKTSCLKEEKKEEEGWGDLAHLSNKKKPNPFKGFQGTKWDRAMLGYPVHNPDPMLRRY